MKSLKFDSWLNKIQISGMRTLLNSEHYGILFLDFDGVLHPDPCKTDKLFCHMDKFCEVLRAMQPNVAVVISSLWRTKYPLKALRKLFPRDLRDCIIDVTPVSKGRKAKRCEEIKAYLSTNNLHNIHYAILDDRPEWFKDLRGMIACNRAVGLEEAQYHKLRQWFDYISDDRKKRAKNGLPAAPHNTPNRIGLYGGEFSMPSQIDTVEDKKQSQGKS